MILNDITGSVHRSKAHVKEDNPEHEGLQWVFKLAFYRTEESVGHTKDTNGQHSKTNLGKAFGTKKKDQRY